MKPLVALLAIAFALAALAAGAVPLDRPFLVSDVEMTVMAGEQPLAKIPPHTEIAVHECRDMNKMIEPVVLIGEREGVVSRDGYRVRWERRPLIFGGRLSCKRW